MADKKHRFEDKVPQQERFPNEAGGVGITSTSKPIDHSNYLGYDYVAEDGDKEFHVPQRRHAFGEFLRESHTKGVKKEQK